MPPSSDIGGKFCGGLFGIGYCWCVKAGSGSGGCDIKAHVTNRIELEKGVLLVVKTPGESAYVTPFLSVGSLL